MIEVLSPGIYSSIQDLGRNNSRGWGVPVSGSMDNFSSLLANKLVNNDKQDAVLEFAFSGPRLRFLSNTYIALTGADMQARVNNQLVPQNQVIAINVGDVIRFGTARRGVHGYMAVSGGFNSEEILGSQSQYKLLTKRSKIFNGQKLAIHPQKTNKIHNRASIKTHDWLFDTFHIKAYAGPEFHVLKKQIQNRLLSVGFEIAPDSNRMAFRFKQKVSVSIKDIVTSSVQPGTVQLTPAGDLIALMRDAQTTGGYARILQISDKSINKLAQKRAGMRIKFQLIE